jgi:hypothetical protein
MATALAVPEPHRVYAVLDGAMRTSHTRANALMSCHTWREFRSRAASVIQINMLCTTDLVPGVFNKECAHRKGQQPCLNNDRVLHAAFAGCKSICIEMMNALLILTSAVDDVSAAGMASRHEPQAA